MIFLGKLAGGVLLVVMWTATARAETGTCQPPVSISGYSVDDAALSAKATAINVWFVEGRPQGMSSEQAVAERQKRIDAVYDEAAQERRAYYAARGCTVSSSKRCSSSAGRRRTCPVVVSPPANMRFDGSISVSGDDFDRWPSATGGSIAYTVKKTGRGSNTGGFSSRAVFNDRWIDERVAAERGLLVAAFQPKLEAGVISTTTRVNSGSTAGRDGPIVSIATELERLEGLRDRGTITQAQFQALRDALLNPDRGS